MPLSVTRISGCVLVWQGPARGQCGQPPERKRRNACNALQCPERNAPRTLSTFATHRLSHFLSASQPRPATRPKHIENASPPGKQRHNQLALCQSMEATLLANSKALSFDTYAEACPEELLDWIWIHTCQQETHPHKSLAASDTLWDDLHPFVNRALKAEKNKHRVEHAQSRTPQKGLFRLYLLALRFSTKFVWRVLRRLTHETLPKTTAIDSCRNTHWSKFQARTRALPDVFACFVDLQLSLFSAHRMICLGNFQRSSKPDRRSGHKSNGLGRGVLCSHAC